MSIAELRERKEKLIAVIQNLTEENLVSVEAAILEVNNSEEDTSIESVYQKATDQYHDTLLKLSQ